MHRFVQQVCTRCHKLYYIDQSENARNKNRCRCRLGNYDGLKRGIGIKWLKYDDMNTYTGDSIKSVLALLIYKIFFASFVLVAIVYTYVLISGPPSPTQRKIQSFRAQLPYNNLETNSVNLPPENWTLINTQINNRVFFLFLMPQSWSHVKRNLTKFVKLQKAS